MFRIILTILGCLILITLYQNCIGPGDGMNTAQTNPSEKQNLAPLSQVNGGNGTPYGGKIRPGTYVRTSTEKFCGSQIKNLGQIVVTETSVTGNIIDGLTCTSVAVNLDLKDLEFASYIDGRVGYFEGIYSSTNDNEAANKDVVDEVWCRKEGSESSVGFDVIIKADYKKRVFTTIAASATMGADGATTQQQYQPLVVDRIFDDMDRVRYRTDGFELEIRQRSFNKQTGLMEGDLRYRLNGMDTDMRINCRLGGELDVMIPRN